MFGKKIAHVSGTKIFSPAPAYFLLTSDDIFY